MATRKRKARKGRVLGRGFWLLAAAVGVAVVGIGLLTWSRTPDGRAALLNLGADALQDDVAAAVDLALGEALPAYRSGPAVPDALAADADPAADLRHDWPLAGGGPIRCRVVEGPEGLAPTQILDDLTSRVDAAGGEVLFAERLRRPGRGALRDPERQLLRVDVGAGGRPTHTLLIHPAGTAPPALRWGGGAAELARASDLLGDPEQPTVAIIVDDWGNGDTDDTRAMLRLDAPLTLSVLPNLRYSRRYALAATDLALPEEPAARRGAQAEAGEQRTARLRRGQGCPVEIVLESRERRRRPPERRREVMLHLPMEPGNPEADPGRSPLRVGMSRDEISVLLDEALRNLPNVTGVNNHMGSAATPDRPTMDRLMAELRARDLLFVDSMTTSESVAYEAAVDAGVPALLNRLFLDQVERDEAQVERLLARVVQSARAVGSAVGICHPYPETVAVLKRELPRYKAQGVRFVTVSELLALKAEQAAAGGGAGGEASR
ncbi:MAG TPA: divergent polysaccharide deacetylase family protein [Candidatus Krumholzibacteria bacterium]|nr:divergent polysaccharide deacetylase family protein [Candidatus Krumholzibacteria bacterium]HRX50852.1 divergent polysaccharide deacetylase family protein [Candidatus Krumholzibacteria bacterium]